MTNKPIGEIAGKIDFMGDKKGKHTIVKKKIA